MPVDLDSNLRIQNPNKAVLCSLMLKEGSTKTSPFFKTACLKKHLPEFSDIERISTPSQNSTNEGLGNFP
jgi:hypothetical protein